MIRKILLTLTLSLAIRSECTDNCLRCESNVCYYCDLSNGYRLVDGQCKQFQVENCYLFNDGGTCVMCNQGYHIDTATQKCIKILLEDQIENCASYDSASTCVHCQAGFFLNQGKCEQITNPIANCEIENSQQVCQQCLPGYVLSIDQKTCQESPQVQNCQAYANIQCETCAPGYLQNKNFYLSQIFSLITNKQKEDFLLRKHAVEQGRVDLNKFKDCLKTEVSNCSKFHTFDFCDVCNPGFYRDLKGQCLTQPNERLPHCAKYSSLSTCIECVEGFWLAETGNCLPVREVSKCKVYSNLQGESRCIECDDTHYLIGFNNCVEREIKMIGNCQKMHPEEESCLRCENTFRLTDDRSGCLPSIAHCRDYQISNYLTKKFTCTICEPGYYYQENEHFCAKGEKEYCLIYENNRNVCLRCENKYYLEQGLCKPHDVIPSCQVYHPRLKNVCMDCNFESFKFLKNTDCLKTEEVTNCAVYFNTKTCAQCQDKYFLNTEGQCELIPPDENCVQRIGTQCGRCLKDFVLENGVCRDPLDYIQNECASHNVDGVTDYERQQCFWCEENRVPLNYKDNYRCVENDYFLYISQKTELDPNCLRYEQDMDYNFTCQMCLFPKVLNEGICIDNCPSNKTLYKQILRPFNKDADRLNESYSVQQVNVCGPLIPYCQVAAPDLHQPYQSVVQYTCVECQQGSVPEIVFNKSSTLIRDTQNEDLQFGNSPVSFRPAQRCVPVNRMHILGEINNTTKEIDNCEFYINLGLTIGCTRCQHGYSGVVLDVVNQCEVYLNNQYTCKTCKQGYYKASAYECKPVLTVAKCKTYSQISNTTKCLECEEGNYVLNDTQCATRSPAGQSQNCTLSKTSDSCTCNEGYFNVKSDGTIQCERKPLNCLTPINQVSCQVCDSTKSFKVNQSTQNDTIFVCQAGGIADCVLYREDQAVCLKCNESAFLKDGICVKHDPLNRCEVRNGLEKNTCQKCERGNVLFEYQTKCLKIKEIDFCEQYDSIETCNKCQDGYRLDNIRARCIKIPDEENCLRQVPINIYDSIDQKVGFIDILDALDLNQFIYTCQLCKPNFFKIEKSITFATTQQVTINNTLQDHPKKDQTFNRFVCKDYLSPMIHQDNCLVNNLTGQNPIQDKAYCKVCKEGYFPEFINDDRYMCLDEGYLKTKSDQTFVGCQKVELNAQGKYECKGCINGYYLDGTQTVTKCLQTCTNVKNEQVMGVAATVLTVTSASHRLCSATAITTFTRQTQMMDFTTSYPIECSGTNILAFERATADLTKISNFNPISKKMELANPIAAYDTKTVCEVNTTTVKGSVGADGMITNCMKYIKETDNNGAVLYCLQCNLGFTGPIGTYNDGAVDVYHLQNCSTAITDCDTTHALNKADTVGRIYRRTVGVNNAFDVESLYSCYKCTGNKTPVLFAPLSSTATVGNLFAQWGFPGDGTTVLNAAGTDQPLMTCEQLYNNSDGSYPTVVPTTPATNWLTGLNTTNLFGGKVGCALAWVDTGSTLGVTSLKCVACKVGFRPIATTVTPDATAWTNEVIDYCEPIENCEDTETEGHWLNACQKCVHFYDYFNANPMIDFGKCVVKRGDVQLENCYAAYYTGPCQICQKGYVKDSSGKCVQLSVAQCDNFTLQNNASNSSKQIITAGTDLNQIAQSVYFLYQEEFNGCTQCQNGFVSTKISSTNSDSGYLPYICSKSPFNLVSPSNSTYANQNKHIENCKNYGLIDEQLLQGVPNSEDQKPSLLTCRICQTGFITTKDGKCTQTSAALQNCKVANEMFGTTCIKCEENFLNVAGVCITFDNTSPITNCKKYNLTDSEYKPYALCNECESGFFLSPEKRLCHPIPLDNCARWGQDTVRNKVWCLGCKKGFVLIEKKHQEQYCYPLTLDSTTEDNQTECEEWSPTDFTKRKLKCLRCKTELTDDTVEKDQYFKIDDQGDILRKTQCLQFESSPGPCQSFDTEHSAQNSDHPEFDAGNPNVDFGTFFTNTFKCLSCTQDQGDDPFLTYWYDQANAICRTRTQVPNCKLHFQFKDQCEVCQDNHVLKNNQCELIKVAETDTPINKGYVQKCQKMDQCEGKVQWEGLHHHLSSLVSCHKCQDTSQIPFVAVKLQTGKQPISLQEYGLPANNVDKFFQSMGEKAVDCRAPQATTFGISTLNWVFPDNCGLGVIDTNQISKASGPEWGVFCGACKPGFKAVFEDQVNNPYVIKSCVVIDQCESSTWFNYCSQCLPNHTYQYVPKQGVKYDTCLDYSSNPNCFAAQQIIEGGNTTLKCQFCKVGYELNPDGYCENILAPRCAQFKFNFRQNYDIFDLATGLTLQANGFGCQQCDTGFVGIYNRKDTVACTASPYHTESRLTTTSRYIYQCQNYRVTQRGQLRCQTCKEGWVLTYDGKCVPGNTVQNCKLALDANHCKVCLDGYVVVDRVCVQGAVTNCVRYANDETSFYQTCLRCASGYFLNNNQCLQGKISNCDEFESENVCRKCKKNFALILTKEMNFYCYPVSQQTNCSEVEQESFMTASLTCKKCTDNTFFLSKDKENFDHKNMCMKFKGQENCVDYDQDEFFFNSTFVCTRCESSYYLNTSNACTKRNVQPKNCLEYQLNSDQCKKCDVGHFLSTDGALCVEYPVGIPKCSQYLDQTTCIRCEAGYFLRENRCLQVMENQKVENCASYLENKECEVCVDGFILINGDCIQVQAQNCATYENINACSSCIAGHGFQYSDDNKFLNCVQKNKPNCLLSEDWAPFKCIECEGNFYPQDNEEGNCVAVTTVIDNCLEYQAEGICKKCSSTTALSADKSLCLISASITSILDANCQSNVITEKPNCNVCSWGHVFSHGYCIQCKDNQLSHGCMNCDPSDQKKCLLCMPGHYMGEDKRCYKNGTKPTPDQPDDNNTTDPVDPTNPDNKDNTDSTWIWSILNSIFLMLLLN